MSEEQLDPNGELDGEALPPEELEESDEAEIASPPSIEEYAKARGWRPKEEWNGEGEHRSAAEYLDFGLDRAKDVSRDLKDLRKTTETMAETQARIMREQLDRTRQEEAAKWQERHRQAVDEGDQAAADQAVQKLTQVSQPAQQDASAQFGAENPWFNNDPIARAVAIAAAGKIANSDGSNIEDQLSAAKEAVHKRFPEYAPKTDTPAKAIEVGKPAATARPVSRGKTFADLPAAAQEAARAMVSQGLLKDTSGYVKQYFNKEGTVE